VSGGAKLRRANARVAARVRHRRGCRGARESGLALLALLIALMLMSVALAGALDVWSLQKRREQEKQLLFAGNQYRQAILRYYRVGHAYPTSVDDLLNDTRFPRPLHHLRRVYPDPVTGKDEWKYLQEGDRIFGVYSSSDALTIKRTGFPRLYTDFENEKTYDGWKFIYLAPGLRSATNNTSSATPDSPMGTIAPYKGGLGLPGGGAAASR
jgi:type II secretory pathway pseudopilin PulG